jgi:hypothetical protein
VGGGDQVVERCGEAVGGFSGVLFRGVVEELVLVAVRGEAGVAVVEFFAGPVAVVDEVDQAAVAAGGDLPFPAEVEVGEGVAGDEVAAAAVGAAVGGFADEAVVVDGPAFPGEVS